MSAALDLTFALVSGRTVLTRRRHRWPLLIGRVFGDPARPGVGSVTIQNAAGTLIPGDVVRQRLHVVDGGAAVVRGQGATTVSGVPGGAVCVEDTDIRVDGRSRLVFDPAPRILTPDARYRCHTRVGVAPGGRAVLVDAVVLHPDLAEAEFGGYESSVRIESAAGELLALDTQLLTSMPRVARAPNAFGTVYLIGGDVPDDLESLTVLTVLTVLTGDRRVYVAVGELPNGAGRVVRLAAWDGGTLRTTIGAVLTGLQQVEVRQAQPGELVERDLQDGGQRGDRGEGGSGQAAGFDLAQGFR